MAGIITDVSSDIQKLQQLRMEIENVKKALKQINVKVDIDIAKGMEAQLKSLMGQYDALVRKVSEAEGKIMVSTKRINDASEKIIKAQEQLSKAADMNPKSGSGNANTTANNAETASVQAQAKAYDELAAEIDAVMGTRMQNIKRLIEEQNAIRLINEEIKNLTKYQSGNSSLTTAQQKRLEQLNNSLLTHKAALSEVRQTLMNNVKMDNVAATSMNGLSQSLSRMKIAYRELTEEERKSPFGKELLASINQADAKIKELDATIGNHQRNVGNYASGWNGLNMSVQQIVRELPAATMGLNMFFLAISNNLPILTDEIKRAKDANEALKASGQKGVPVWKQLVSSLFSWQTAMMVGITVLSMYGKEIVEWTSNLFKSKDAILSTEEAMEKVNESLEKNNGSYGSNILSVKKLSSEWKKLSSQKEQLQWINDNKTEFNKLGISINGVKDAENAFVKNTSAIIEAFKLRAKATAAQKLAADEYEKALVKRNEAETKQNKLEEEGPTAVDRLKAAIYGRRKIVPGAQGTIGATVTDYEQSVRDNIKSLNSEADAAEKAGDAYFDLAAGYEKAAKSELDKSGIEESHKKVNDNTNKITNQQSRIVEIERKNATDRIRQQEDLENKVAQSRIDAMDEGFEKEKAQMELNHKKELQEIGRQRQDYINAIIQMEKEAFDAKEKLKASKDKNYKTKAFDSSTVSVDTSAFDIMGKETRERQKMEIADFYKDSLSEYQDYVTKYNATREKFAKERERYKNAGASGAQLKEIDYQEEETLKAIDNEFAAREESFNSWADNVIDLSLEKLRESLNQAYQEMMNMEISDPDNPDLARKRAEVDTLRKSLEKKEIEKEISPGKSTKDWDKLYKVLTDVNDVFEEIGDTVGGTFGEIISLAGGIASSSLQAVGAIKAINAEMSALDKASAVLAAISAGMKIISGIGGFFKEKFGADYSEYEALKSQYDTLINIWDQLIDKKMEYIDIDYGIEAQKAADEAARLVNVQIERQRQLIKQLASSGSSAGSHSLGYRINDRLTAEDYERISGLVGEKITAEYQLWDLSSEQMEKLLTDERLVSVLGEVNGEFIDYIQNIADYGEQLEEIAQKEKEALTGIGLDEFKSGYVDLLSDLDSTNEDFADNFEKYLQNAIFSSLIANKYKEEIESLYNQWAADSESGGKLTPEEAERLRQEQKELTEQMLADREQLMNDFGWESSGGTSAQQASSAVKVQASQESVDETNGRLTAIQETGYRIENANQQQAIAITELKGSISGLLSKMGGMYNISDETRTILANSYLELQQIRENTGEIVKPIKQMQKDMEEVKRNTSRL
ncbi:conserved domain protein [Paraprevotella xylaniphila YIT 11841]|uniref:Conserved domain protein n=1 Tax=Paraprevotella xylaniphila YIT 11841 TaxID=762982 RepID=F3QSM9_9BACT|nr:hypothetical protein [Paraprevotella xylaniphila]EGG55316.1 conserved domain protein [Paraprevotella xylaniphila YIT 11841]